jgi:hypothetical protein
MKRAEGEAEKEQARGMVQVEPIGAEQVSVPAPPTMRQVLFWHSKWVWRGTIVPQLPSDEQEEATPPALFTQERESGSHTPCTTLSQSEFDWHLSGPLPNMVPQELFTHS